MKQMGKSNGQNRPGRRPGLRSSTKLPTQPNVSGKDNAHVLNGKGHVPRETKEAKKDVVRSKVVDSNQFSNEDLVLWKKPITTISYFILEALHLLVGCFQWLRHHIKAAVFVLLLIASIVLLFTLNGPHQRYLAKVQTQFLWCSYWVGLGILSSVGLGTGLHTFLLYLGPHIASVTLAAYECGSLNFPSPPYPDEIVCPEDSPSTSSVVSVLSIMSKVRLEAFMWGAGTALGELPPYFMAKAARLSGNEDIDISSSDENSISESSNSDNNKLKTDKIILKKEQLFSKARKVIKDLIKGVGFFGILACASIPNPLFDLAGITCGHFLVPFWTFFGATLIGKAVIKMHIQKLFVIVAFNELHVETFVQFIRNIPYVGKYLNEPFREFLIKQKASLHRQADTRAVKESSWLQWIFERIVILMVVYFLISIINSMAQNRLKRMQKKSTSQPKKRRKIL